MSVFRGYRFYTLCSVYLLQCINIYLFPFQCLAVLFKQCYKEDRVKRYTPTLNLRSVET